MKRCLVLVVALVLAAGCRKTDGPASAGTAAPAPGSASGPGGAPMPPPLPEGHQCLPAVVCTEWVGCALVAAGKVVSADKLAAGEPVTIANACSGGKPCVAARAMPAGTVCAPEEIPAVIDPPPYTCVYDGKTCAQR